MIEGTFDQLISDRNFRDKIRSQNSSGRVMYIINNFMMKVPGGFIYDFQDRQFKAKVDEAIALTGISPERISELNLQRHDNFTQQVEEELFEVTYPVYCVMRSLGHKRIRLIG